MSVDAFIATAASMLRNGDDPESVRTTLGLSAEELDQARAFTEPTTPEAPKPTEPTATSRPALKGVQALLVWAEEHAAAGIRGRAARIRSDLADLEARRAVDLAQQQAEQRVAQARADLEAAQAELRELKAQPRTQATPAARELAAASSRTCPRSPQELAAVRAWARAHGHQVADRGLVAKQVLAAYDHAHPHTTPSLKEAS
ncbi:histone-like nucleoid-structuring protein Lsr2 [Streptomyces sp. NPDC001941]|uniref:Lsr2 family DNA-binding protein n=1 Tax=Streptomyces sp. NPDC001941 TaxID=3154659 RepID=UPI003325BCE8